MSKFAWLTNKQYDFKTGGTRRVKEKVPNPWGLYDILGNVFEWCFHYYGEFSGSPEIDPTGPETSSYRVIRGVRWSSHVQDVRSACREYWRPSGRDSIVGFGCTIQSSSSPNGVSASRAR